jgi:glycosyltransferase involved in cell wall biosynthesis
MQNPSSSEASDCCETVRLSILIPVRDEAAFLKDCLASIAALPDLSCEVVLIDDGSRDETYAIAAGMAAHMAVPMRLLRNPGRGKAAALNHGYSVARGQTFILLAGDDLLASDALAARVKAVAGPGPQLAQCRYRSFSDTHPELADVEFPRPGMLDHVAGGAVSFNHDFARLYFPIPEVLPNEDTWLRALTLAMQLPIATVDCLGLHYRIHEGNSVGPLRSFAEIDRNLRQRNAAYAIALERFGEQATLEGRARLQALVRAERHRAAGHWEEILFSRGLSRSDRAMMLANATPWLHALKIRFLPRLRRVLGI